MTGPGMASDGEDEPSAAEPPGGRRDGLSARAFPGPMAYAGIGLLNAVCLLGGGALGWLLDRSIGTLPVFLLLGLLLGGAAGVLGTRGELRRYDR